MELAPISPTGRAFYFALAALVLWVGSVHVFKPQLLESFYALKPTTNYSQSTKVKIGLGMICLSVIICIVAILAPGQP